MTRSHQSTSLGGGLFATDHVVEQDDPLLAAVRGAKEGDPRAVRQFLEGIAPLVRRTCTATLGSGHADLEDTMQECLFSAVKALPSYRFEGDIRHYVTKISLRIAIANRRSSVARWRRNVTIAAEQAVDRPIPTPDDWAADDVELVRRILDQLTQVQSEALFLRIVLGFSIDEIGTMTGVSPNTVKTRLRLGKNALRGHVQRPSFWKRWLQEKRG